MYYKTDGEKHVFTTVTPDRKQSAFSFNFQTQNNANIYSNDTSGLMFTLHIENPSKTLTVYSIRDTVSVLRWIMHTAP
jgi:alpha-glucosidase (family GH31 glycosyl hydrolase)